MRLLDVFQLFAADKQAAWTDGPYCSICQRHRVLSPGGVCPTCADDRKRT